MPEPSVWCSAPVARLCAAVLCGSVGVVLSTGCVTVSPAERQQLSTPEMTPATDATEEVWHTHVEAAREAGFGGHGAAGGGCGCG